MENQDKWRKPSIFLSTPTAYVTIFPSADGQCLNLLPGSGISSCILTGTAHMWGSDQR